MKARWMVVFLIGWALLAPPAHGATVSITPATSTVARGGGITFTVTVEPATYVQGVSVTYQGESGQDVGTGVPFYATHTFNSPADNLVVTARVTYSNGDPDGQATATVSVVGLVISGSANPPRAWSTGYAVQSNPSGKALSQINWTYSWSDGSNTYQNSATWSGKMVVPGTLVVTAVVSGVAAQASKPVAITPRSWPISITCVQDNDPDYGDPPIPWVELGSNRDQNSHYSNYFFAPRNGDTDFSPARTLSQVTSGPCAGLWYVASSTLKCQRETVISRYVKPGGPVLGATNFYAANANCFSSSVDDFIQALKNHEYRGTPDTPKSWGGHQGRTESAIIDLSCDPRQRIEALTDRNPSNLSETINATINSDEMTVIDYATDELYMETWGPNWGSGNGLGCGDHSSWDDSTSAWTDCVTGPSKF